MDITTFSQLIGSVGFPIAACCVMFIQNNKLQQTLSDLSKTLSSMNERISDIENHIKEEWLKCIQTVN